MNFVFLLSAVACATHLAVGKRGIGEVGFYDDISFLPTQPKGNFDFLSSVGTAVESLNAAYAAAQIVKYYGDERLLAPILDNIIAKAHDGVKEAENIFTKEVPRVEIRRGNTRLAAKSKVDVMKPLTEANNRQQQYMKAALNRAEVATVDAEALVLFVARLSGAKPTIQEVAAKNLQCTNLNSILFWEGAVRAVVYTTRRLTQFEKVLVALEKISDPSHTKETSTVIQSLLELTHNRVVTYAGHIMACEDAIEGEIAQASAKASANMKSVTIPTRRRSSIDPKELAKLTSKPLSMEGVQAFEKASVPTKRVRGRLDAIPEDGRTATQPAPQPAPRTKTKRRGQGTSNRPPKTRKSAFQPVPQTTVWV